MTYRFGPFELDEAGRALTRAQAEIALQPRVFDLLVYLLSSEGRLVTKDELLDAVWPNVTVTDNSLQRAISALRGVLREGGLGDAIRTVPGRGYRLMLATFPADAPPTDDTVIAGARSALAERRWADAALAFAEADQDGLVTESDLDGWALALQCAGRPADAIPVLVRAIAAHERGGRIAQSACDAVILAGLHLERGQQSVGAGWLSHAEDRASEIRDPEVQGLVLWTKSKIAAFSGDPAQALVFAEEAYAITRHSGALRAEALSLAYRGLYRLTLGDAEGGIADQDHAAALGLSGNVDPVTGGTLYCNILWASRMFGDWARADEWTLGFQQFCADNRMELTGACQLHRSEVLGIKGSLDEALERVTDSLVRLAHDAPWAMGDAWRVRGDIMAASGDREAALEAYERCYAAGWSPEPGRAMLLMEAGDHEAAFASLERALLDRSWWTLQRRGLLLAHLAVVAARTGRHAQAAGLVAELTASDSRWSQASIRALVNETQAILDLEKDDRRAALARLHLARQLWSSVDARVQAARLRLCIADELLAQGDRRGAQTELRAAELAAAQLKARGLSKDCAILQERLDAAPDYAAAS